MIHKQTRRELFITAAALAIPAHTARARTPSPVTVHSTADHIEISNDRIKATFSSVGNGIEQEYYARAGQSWVRLVRALQPASPRPEGTAPLYSDREVAEDKRLLAASFLQWMKVGPQQQDRSSVILWGRMGDTTFEQTISLDAEADCFHIDVRTTLGGDPPRVEYVLSTFIFEVDKLDYTHAPCMKREPADVIGDRVFHSPAAILQSDSRFTALVPDLDVLKTTLVYAPEARPIDGPRQFRILQDRDTITMPTILDVDLQSGISPFPVFSFGFADYLTQQHMYWKHENLHGAFVRTLSTNKLHYAFDLFVSGVAEKYFGYQTVSRHIWAKSGSRYARQPKPQAMPFSQYASGLLPGGLQLQG